MWSWFEFSVSSSLISGVKGASTPPKVLICIKLVKMSQKFSHFLYFYRSFHIFYTFLLLTLWHLAIFGDFLKKHRNTQGFAWEFLQSCKCYGPGRSVKRRCKSSSLHSKKNFGWGVQIFCEWRHKWRTFRPPWPT